MSPLLVTSLALMAFTRPHASEGGQTPDQLRRQARYTEALEVARSMGDPVERAREVLETRYHAGDLAGALGVGLDGLATAPQDLWLLWRSSRLAIDMAAAPLALDLTRRLALAASNLEGDDLAEDTRSFWLGESDALSQEAWELTDLRRRQAVARRRARWSVLGGIGLLLGAVVWGLQRSEPAQTAGRARV